MLPVGEILLTVSVTTPALKDIGLSVVVSSVHLSPITLSTSIPPKNNTTNIELANKEVLCLWFASSDKIVIS